MHVRSYACTDFKAMSFQMFRQSIQCEISEVLVVDRIELVLRKNHVTVVHFDAKNTTYSQCMPACLSDIF